MSFINRIFRANEDDITGRSLALMMEAIALNAVHLDIAEYRRFQDLFRGHAQELMADQITPARAMVVTGAAIQTLETFARETERQIAKRTNELCSVAGLLATALTGACEGNQRVAAGLQGLEKRLGTAFKSDDIPAVRRKLEQCLVATRGHAGTADSPAGDPSSTYASPYLPMRASANASAGASASLGLIDPTAERASASQFQPRPATLEQTKQGQPITHPATLHQATLQEAQEAQEPRTAPEQTISGNALVPGVKTGTARMPLRQTSKLLPGAEDPITGLQGKQVAQVAIEDAIKTCMYSAAVPVVVERIQSINARFGSKYGDSVLLAMAQILAQKMGPNDLLFHWQGACLLALLQRTGSAEEIQREMARQLSGRVEHAIAVGDRSVLLSGSFSWKVLPLWELTAEEVSEKVTAFSLRNGA